MPEGQPPSARHCSRCHYGSHQGALGATRPKRYQAGLGFSSAQDAGAMISVSRLFFMIARLMPASQAVPGQLISRLARVIYARMIISRLTPAASGRHGVI